MCVCSRGQLLGSSSVVYLILWERVSHLTRSLSFQLGSLAGKPLGSACLYPFPKIASGSWYFSMFPRATVQWQSTQHTLGFVFNSQHWKEVFPRCWTVGNSPTQKIYAVQQRFRTQKSEPLWSSVLYSVLSSSIRSEDIYCLQPWYLGLPGWGCGTLQ